MNDVVQVIVSGALVEIDPANVVLLIADRLPEAIPDKVLAHGHLMVCAGLAFLYAPDSLLMHRVVDDFGRDYRGEAAFDFVLRKGDSFPRSDVFGRRSAGIEIEQVFLKQLDLARGVQVYAYAEGGNDPLAHIKTIVTIEGQQSLVTLPATILNGLSQRVVDRFDASALRDSLIESSAPKS